MPDSGALDGSTDISDQSTKGATLTLYGDTQVDTSLGYPTILFDGTGDYILIPDSDVFDFQNEGSIEIIFVKTANTKTEFVYSKRYNGDASTLCSFQIVSTADGALFFGWYDRAGTYCSVSTADGAITVGQKYHFEASVDAIGVLRCFLDGVLVGSGSQGANPISLNSRSLCVARLNNYTGDDFSGHLMIRHTHGRARHSSDDSFTPPESFVVGE